MFFRSRSMALAALGFAAAQVAAQQNQPYCDGSTGMCFSGYTDPTLNITVGLVFPPLQPTGSSTPNSTEYIVQLVAPASYGWTGVSLGGTMADSLLFTLWTNANQIVLGPRWTSGYVLPDVYAGPIVTVLHSSINSSYVSATWRCQNCTTWADGSMGSGDLGGSELMGYVTNTDTPPDDPADVGSSFTEHNQFNLFGCDLSTVHSSLYSSYVSGTSTTTSAPSTPSTTPVTSTTTSIGATQTKYGQCGGTGYTGPTTCATGSSCVAVSPPYYSQCQ